MEFQQQQRQKKQAAASGIKRDRFRRSISTLIKYQEFLLLLELIKF